MRVTEKLTDVQVKLKAPKNLYNKFGEYSYRNAEGILEAVKPFLTMVNASLTLSDDIIAVGDRIYVKAIAEFIDNETGDVVRVQAFARESEEKKKLDASQLTGVASSYARKYALNGLFLLDDTKDADTNEFAKQTQDAAGSVQKPIEAPKPIERANVLTDTEVLAIKALAEKKAVPEEQILKRFGVDDLHQLDNAAYIKVMALLNKSSGKATA